MEEASLNRETLELANELVRERLQAQKEGIERVEAKAAILLGFAAVAAQFVVSQARGGWTVAALIAYGVALASGAVAIALYEHEFPPDPGRLIDAYLDVQPEHLLDVLVRTRAQAFYRNTRHARVKRRAWFATLGALAVAVGLSSVAAWRDDDRSGQRQPIDPPASTPTPSEPTRPA